MAANVQASGVLAVTFLKSKTNVKQRMADNSGLEVIGGIQILFISAGCWYFEAMPRSRKTHEKKGGPSFDGWT